ncbi:unannotated protein [freshwater metagenome]|uniref:Unannotated protein n=1 Tax=freshwater metagenome TaxID=449393 RepID=A0A6J7HK91_9ZZZZ|nr:mycofactocin-coupled SDR family oxidoreductase [Actinomycetota bacterium]
MGLLEGKVAFITGAGRGMGRAHAVRLAREGADIIALDVCAPIDLIPYDLASPEDLAQTAHDVEALGRRIVTRQADVRDLAAVQAAVDDGVAEFGRLDVVVANAGVVGVQAHENDPRAVFDTTIAVNLGGVWNTVHAAVPALRETGDGGAIVLISSTQGLTGRGGNGTGAGDGYAASKHAVVGLMRAWATWLAPDHIRVNTVHPTGVNTPMVVGNAAMGEYIAQNPEVLNALANLMPVEVLAPEDISAAVAWLVSDEARYVTGVTLPVDAGFVAR